MKKKDVEMSLHLTLTSDTPSSDPSKPSTSSIKNPRTNVRAGAILQMILINFMCHKNIILTFANNINYIIGLNGTGKSTIIHALVVGLEGEASLTIHGKKIERRIVSTSAKDVQNICTYFNIHVGNPACLLNEHVSTELIRNKDPHQLFLIFMKATMENPASRQYCRNIEDDLVERIQNSFQQILLLSRLDGFININMREETLNMIVVKDTRVLLMAYLSGVDGTIAVFAFIYAVWQCTQFPFHFFDKVDVLLHNTFPCKAVMNAILDYAKQNSDMQFVFVKINNVSLGNDNLIAIHIWMIRIMMIIALLSLRRG